VQPKHSPREAKLVYARRPEGAEAVGVNADVLAIVAVKADFLASALWGWVE
jgi:hypothetical protein